MLRLADDRDQNDMKKLATKNETHAELQYAYQYFNKALFGSQLPHCLITLNRRNGMAGFYVGKLWANGKKRSDEITINPDLLSKVSIKEIMQTLVHEMAHCWQDNHGEKKSRSGYHNVEWGNKMREIGLMPSSTGAPGGSPLGQKMSDYPMEDGKFLEVFERLMAKGFKINWMPASLLGKKPKPKPVSKQKYSCPMCSANVWAKPNLNISCMDCDETFEEV